MIPVTVTWTPRGGSTVTARGRFLSHDGTLDAERVREVLGMPPGLDVGVVAVVVPETKSVTVTSWAGVFELTMEDD